MTVVVDQSRLVMNAFAAIFQNNLITADLVTWKKFDGEYNPRNRLQVDEQVGPRYAITETTDGVADLSSGVQDTVFGSERYIINKTFGSSMGWGDFAAIRDIGDARESEAIKNAAINLAEKIDAYVLNTAVFASHDWVTSDVTKGISTYTDFVQGYTRLKANGVDDSDLRGVLTYDDKQALGATVVGINSPALDEMASGVFRKGFDSEIGGVPVLFTQQLPTFTNGNDVTGVTVHGANQNVNYSDVSVSPAPGQYASQDIDLAGFTANTGTLAAGAVFTLGVGGTPVYAWDNRLGAAKNYLQQFTVLPNPNTSDGSYTADSSGYITARIFPAIIVPGTGSGGDVDVNTANATCSVVPADTAAATFIGSASTGYKPRFIMQKSAIVVNTQDLVLPVTGIGTRKQLTKVPLSVRMWRNSVFNTGEHDIRFDVALTANVRAAGRDRVVRINGN